MNVEEIQQVVRAVEQSIREITVMVPSTDFYACDRDYDRHYLRYIDPDVLLEALKQNLTQSQFED